jgi:integrase
MKPFYPVIKLSDGIIIDSTGHPYKPFEVFVSHLHWNEYSKNTIELYSEHVFRFLNYVHIAKETSSVPVDRHQLRLIILSYANYLIHAEDSENEIVKEVIKHKGKKKKTKISSVPCIDHAVSLFIRLGELEQEDMEDGSIDPLFEAVTTTIPPSERKNIKKSSMVAGVIKGGLTAKERVRLGIIMTGKGKKSKSKYTIRVTRSIDLGNIKDLINSAPSYRDKAFYALLAASGCRSHEALQITLGDVDVTNKSVYLRDPAVKDPNKLGLTLEEQESLSWKGRNTDMTFLIEPFKSMFFEYLKEYLRKERVNLVSHPFIFQKKNDQRPLFCSDRSSRIKQFKSAAKKAGIDDLTGISPHSLRHSYGFYTLNYLPLPNNQFGLPMTYVKVLMGHESLASTEVYAEKDKELLKAQISYANELIMGGDSTDITQYRIQYHQQELDRIKRTVEDVDNKKVENRAINYD